MKPRAGLRFLTAVLAAGFVAGACTDELSLGLDDRHPGPDDGGYAGPGYPRLPAMWVQDLQSPLRITTTTGDLLLTDSRRQLVIQVNPATLKWVNAIFIDGKPLGVAYWDPFLFVGNAKRQTVEVYHGQGGRKVNDFGRGKVGYPSDIAVDFENSRIAVVDGRDKVVKVFTPGGASVLTLGDRGTGKLDNPVGIAVDSVRGEILVSDYGNLSAEGHASVKIFDFQGTFRAEISGRGTCGGGICTEGFSRPQGLAVGDDGRIYLADALLGKVLVFDRETLMKVGEIGDRATLQFTTDVAVGAGGDLFIVSNRNREIRVLRRGTAQ